MVLSSPSARDRSHEKHVVDDNDLESFHEQEFHKQEALQAKMGRQGRKKEIENNTVTKSDLLELGESLRAVVKHELGESLRAVVEHELGESLRAAVKHVETKLTRQVTNLKQEVKSVETKLLQQMKAMQTKLSSTNKQLAALARTSGAQVEHIVRDKMKIEAKSGNPKFSSFGSTLNRSELKFVHLQGVCRYLHITKEEQQLVLEGLIQTLSGADLSKFIQHVLKAVKAPKNKLDGDLCNTFSAQMKRMLSGIQGDHRKLKVLAIIDVLELLEDVNLMDDVELAQKLWQLVKSGQLTLESPFFFMFMIYSSTKGAVIQAELQIDARGLCVRSQSSIFVNLAEIKSSSALLKSAKAQLLIIKCVFEKLLEFLPGSALHMKKLILIYEKDEKDSVKGAKNEEEDLELAQGDLEVYYF